LPSERILMATPGDDGDKDIYMYTMKIIHNCQLFLLFLQYNHIFFYFEGESASKSSISFKKSTIVF